MLIQTRAFGDIEIQEDQFIDFPQGLPGFEQLRTFTLIAIDPELPFSYLQSVEEANVSFLVVDPFVFFPDYEFDLPESVQLELDIRRPEDIQVWSIATVQGNLQEATVNLLGPIVINLASGKGKQVILHNTEYQVRHKLPLEEPTKEG